MIQAKHKKAIPSIVGEKKVDVENSPTHTHTHAWQSVFFYFTWRMWALKYYVRTRVIVGNIMIYID